MFRRLFSSLGKSTPSRVVRLGNSSPISFALPNGCHHEAEGDKDCFIMPRVNDLNGPISLRMTHLRDHSGVITDETLQRELLLRIQPDSEIHRFGKNLVSPLIREETAEDGTDWIYLHHMITVGGHLCTATVQIIKERRTEPQVAELRDMLPAIFESMHS
ncbi:MAG TPA: hypothetical protein VGE67_16155 [Haloferula sp.]